ncbi:MAG: glutamate 5-kinase [Spirochaetota bacterium]
MPRKGILKGVRRIVVKIGTSLITEDGKISRRCIERLVGDIAALIDQKYQVVVVTSGAISAGSGALGKKRENLSLPEKQAMAAVGQSILMDEYRKCFRKHGREIGQILLTEDDVKHRRRFLNARHTFNALIEMGVVPVVNENDSVAVKEIRFGDNDTLSAHVANIVEAGLLIILSDVEGFYRDLADEIPLEEIGAIDEDVRRRAGGAGSTHGTGGMATKIRAAEIIMKSGELMLIANGRKSGVLPAILRGEKLGTLFRGGNSHMQSRKRWIAFNMRSSGSITIDGGAVNAIVSSKKSLLASGVTGVTGKFNPGDAVDVLNENGDTVGKGISNYSAAELSLIKGKKTRDIRGLLGGTYYEEVINRDDMIIYDVP